MASKGDVVYIEDFEFSDGTKGNKLAVILTDGDVYLSIKTTSNPTRYRNAKPGCNADLKVYFIPKGTCDLHEDTYVQLNEIFEFSGIEMVKGHWERRIKTITTLPAQNFNELRNCLKLLSDDIAEEHFRLLFR